MARTFTIQKDYYDTGHVMFPKSRITFETGLTVLVGCNGIGKSTMLHWLEHKLEAEGTEYIMFDNQVDGGSNSIDNQAWLGNDEFVMTALVSSEGENIFLNLSEQAKKIGMEVTKCRQNHISELYILLDAVDSGLSIDNIVEFKNFLKEQVLQDCVENGVDCYIVCSANAFEMARNERIYDIAHGKYTIAQNYDEYYDLVMQSAGIKAKR